MKRFRLKKEAVESLRFEAEQAERTGDYGKVAEIRYGKIIELEKEIAALKQIIEKKRSKGPHPGGGSL